MLKFHEFWSLNNQIVESRTKLKLIKNMPTLKLTPKEQIDKLKKSWGVAPSHKSRGPKVVNTDLETRSRLPESKGKTNPDVEVSLATNFIDYERPFP